MLWNAVVDAEEEIQMVKEGEREESDHLPTVVTVKSSELENDKRPKEKNEAKVSVKSV